MSTEIVNLEHDSDETLMGHVQGGNLEPLEPLFRRHHEGLYRLFYLMTGDPEASGFYLRELFQRVVRFRALYERNTSFSVWLYQLAIRCLQEAEGGDLDAPRLDERVVETLPTVQQALLEMSTYNRARVVLARDRNLSMETLAGIFATRADKFGSDVVMGLAALNGFHARVRAGRT